MRRQLSVSGSSACLRSRSLTRDRSHRRSSTSPNGEKVQVVQAFLITPPRKPKSHRLVKGCGGKSITAVVRPIARPVIRCGVARITVATVSIARWCGVVNPSRNAGSAWLIPLHSGTRHLASHIAVQCVGSSIPILAAPARPSLKVSFRRDRASSRPKFPTAN